MAEDRVLAVAPGQQWLLVQAKAAEHYSTLEDGDVMCSFTLPGDGNKPGRHRGKIILHPGDTLKVVYGK